MKRVIQPEVKVKSQSHVSAVRNFQCYQGLHGKHAVKRGIWVPTQHLLWDQGKPRKTLIELAGRRTFRMQLTSSQQSSIKYASPNISLYPCCCVLLFLFLTSCFLQLLLCAYDVDKLQTLYITCRRNKRISEQTCIQIYLYR
jgi:hypothetical protein